MAQCANCVLTRRSKKKHRYSITSSALSRLDGGTVPLFTSANIRLERDGRHSFLADFLLEGLCIRNSESDVLHYENLSSEGRWQCYAR
jgi:hypothetical protein